MLSNRKGDRSNGHPDARNLNSLPNNRNTFKRSNTRAVFGLAQVRHANVYNDWMEQEDLDGYLPDIQRLVEKILSAKAA